MTAIPKPKRVTDRRYLKFVKEHDCLARYTMTCEGPLDPHHVMPVSLGGSDYTALPLCRKHHGEAHMSPSAFEQKYAVLFDYEIEQLLKEYRKVEVKPRAASREQKIKPFKKKKLIRAWCHFDGEIRFPIFETLHDAIIWEPPKGTKHKIVRCQIRVEGK